MQSTNRALLDRQAGEESTTKPSLVVINFDMDMDTVLLLLHLLILLKSIMHTCHVIPLTGHSLPEEQALSDFFQHTFIMCV